MARAYTVTSKEGEVLAWAATQGEAVAKKKELGAKSWQLCEVPTSPKEDFMEFLNLNVVGKPVKMP